VTAEQKQVVDDLEERISDAYETGARHDCYILCAQLIVFAKEIKEQGGITQARYRAILDSCADVYNLFSV